MGRPSINTDHPLQHIRVTAGMTQSEFADALGISKSEISKRETRSRGFKDIPASLRKKVAHEFGAVIYPRAGIKPTGWGGEPLTHEYITQHRKQRIDWRLVKYPPADLVRAIELVAKVCEKLHREESLGHALEQAVKNLCVSPSLRHEIRNLLKEQIKAKRPEDTISATWLACAIEDADLMKNLPTLPTIAAHHKKIEAALPGVKGITKENLDEFMHQQRLKGAGDFEDF